MSPFLSKTSGIMSGVHPHRNALVMHDHVERRLFRLCLGDHGELIARAHPVAVRRRIGHCGQRATCPPSRPARAVAVEGIERCWALSHAVLLRELARQPVAGWAANTPAGGYSPACDPASTSPPPRSHVSSQPIRSRAGRSVMRLVEPGSVSDLVRHPKIYCGKDRRFVSRCTHTSTTGSGFKSQALRLSRAPQCGGPWGPVVPCAGRGVMRSPTAGSSAGRCVAFPCPRCVPEAAEGRRCRPRVRGYLFLRWVVRVLPW